MTREPTRHLRQLPPTAVTRIAPLVDRRAMGDLLLALLGVLLTLAVLLSAARAHAARMDEMSDAAAHHAATEQWLQPIFGSTIAMTSARTVPLTGYVLAGLLSWVALTVGRALLVRAAPHDMDHEPIGAAGDVDDDAQPLHLPAATPAAAIRVAA